MQWPQDGNERIGSLTRKALVIGQVSGWLDMAGHNDGASATLAEGRAQRRGFAC